MTDSPHVGRSESCPQVCSRCADAMAWRCGPAGKLSVGWPVLSLSMTVDSNNQTSSGSGTTSKIDIHIKQAVRAFLSGGAVAGIVITVLVVAFSAAFYIWVSLPSRGADAHQV